VLSCGGDEDKEEHGEGHTGGCGRHGNAHGQHDDHDDHTISIDIIVLIDTEPCYSSIDVLPTVLLISISNINIDRIILFDYNSSPITT
jgi:hypothetical protein